MFQGETIMTGANNKEFGTNGYSKLKIMSSPAGYYLGTTFEGDDEGEDRCGEMPGTRETEYMSEKEAKGALVLWNKGFTVKMRVL